MTKNILFSHSLSRRKFVNFSNNAVKSLIGVIGFNYFFNDPKKLISLSKPTQTNTFNFEVITIDSEGKIIKKEAKSAKYQSLDLGNGETLELVYIPEGEFTMGSPTEEKYREDSEGPQHNVKVSGFWLGKYPVTQSQWRIAMNNNPSCFTGDKLPVDSVNWFDAVSFCQKLSQKFGKNITLPSEEQWEYACRAGTTTPFYFGQTITGDLANYDATHIYGFESKGVYRDKTTEVGIFPPNAFGLYDLHGNVSEWCLNWYYGNYQTESTDSIQYKILRGGSWYDAPTNCRSASRDWAIPKAYYGNVGFRVALLEE